MLQSEQEVRGEDERGSLPRAALESEDVQIGEAGKESVLGHWLTLFL
jgi:hypothetical protein